MIHVNPGVIGGVGGNRIGGLLGSVMALSPAAWYRYGIGLTDAGAGACSLWADQSGNGRDLTAAGAARPTIQADKSLLFDGVANVLTAIFTHNLPVTWYALLNPVTITNGDRVLSGPVATAVVLETAANCQLFCTGGAATNTTFVAGSYLVFGAVFNGASSAFQVNSITTTGDPGSNNPGGICVGAASGGANAANIQVKEVILFAAAHDANTRAGVIRYLAQVGGISV